MLRSALAPETPTTSIVTNLVILGSISLTSLFNDLLYMEIKPVIFLTLLIFATSEVRIVNHLLKISHSSKICTQMICFLQYLLYVLLTKQAFQYYLSCPSSYRMYV